MNLPTLNGWDVLKLLKENIKTRHIPVKIMSIDTPHIATKRMGAINFIQKPIEPDQLDIAIKQLISKTQKEKNLLIVEDNDIIRNNLIEILNAKDINIQAVSNAADAIVAIKEKIFDCAIIDIGLPDMNGFTLLKKIKKLHCYLPIIIYSGRDFTKDELKTLREYSESIILKTAESEARLLDETSLFLHRLHSNFTNSQNQILNYSSKNNKTFLNKKVLIVDDDIRNIFALDSLLCERGFITISAYNGKEAILELEKNKDIDIILMDIMMPVMDGYEAIEKIKKDSKNRNIPIIALTAKAQKEDRQKCLDVGADDYITKPIDEEQLLQLMKVWINNR
jgi:CheY-like chemotaxis protein